jgi:PST family polysaccharide transporter
MLFGPLFIESTEVLIIYAWSLFFMGLLVSSSKYLLVINKNKIILIRSILGLVSNILLNFILIPMMGIKGAAWATLISYSIAAYFSNIFFKELRPIMISQITSVFYLARNVFEKIKFR